MSIPATTATDFSNPVLMGATEDESLSPAMQDFVDEGVITQEAAVNLERRHGSVSLPNNSLIMAFLQTIKEANAQVQSVSYEQGVTVFEFKMDGAEKRFTAALLKGIGNITGAIVGGATAFGVGSTKVGASATQAGYNFGNAMANTPFEIGSSAVEKEAEKLQNFGELFERNLQKMDQKASNFNQLSLSIAQGQ